MVGLAAAVLVLAAEAAIPPSPARWVEDPAGFLSPSTRSALDARLESYEHATGHQIVVWIGTSLDGTPLDDWSVRTFAAWKIGRKGLDDGVAMFVFADDRKIDIEVGYGLEDKLPDAIASRIVREVMVPRLHVGDRDGAVTAGVDAILAGIEGKPWAGTVTTVPPPKASMAKKLVGGLVLIAFVIFAITHPRMALFLLWTFMRRGGGGFGGFGGGGDGGFSGGGGSSGGGGARGGW